MTHLWILAASIVLNVCGQISIKQSILNFQDAAGGTVYFGMATAVPILTAPLTLLGLQRLIGTLVVALGVILVGTSK